MNPIRQWAIEELRHMVLTALGEHDAAVWLFGSCTRDDVRQHSDIDIAILRVISCQPGSFQSRMTWISSTCGARNPALVEEVRREGVKWRE